MWAMRQLVTTAVKRSGQYRQALSAQIGQRSVSNGTTGKKGRLVIFDKDGTLVTFQDSWIDWTINMTEKYAEKVQKPIHDELYQVMGFNPETQRFSDGLICDTDENIMKTLSAYLQTHGLEAQEATNFVENNYFCYKTSNHTTVPVGDPKSIFTELKKHGIKIAVCTSDSVLGKDAMIRDLKLEELVDFSLCGDESEMQPKPHPGNIEYICRQVGVQPCEVIMVGDAVRDMEMGRAAKVGKSIGVLSGVCDEEHLEEVADVVIPSITHILPEIIPGYKS